MGEEHQRLDLTIRVTKVDGLADAVVGRALELDVRSQDTVHRLRQGLAVRKSHRHVVEPVVPGGGGEPPCDSQVLSPMWWW